MCEAGLGRLGFLPCPATRSRGLCKISAHVASSSNAQLFSGGEKRRTGHDSFFCHDSLFDLVDFANFCQCRIQLKCTTFSGWKKEGGEAHRVTLSLSVSRHTRAGEMCVRLCCEQISQSKGLVSINRSEAAALVSTTPRLRPRSSTNDLAPLHCMGWISSRHTHPPFRAREEPLYCGFATAGAEGRSTRVYRCLPTSRR